MKRSVWIPGVLLLFVLLFAACAAPAAPAAPAASDATATEASSEEAAPAEAAPAEAASEEPVELRVMWWGVDQRHQRTLAVIELFEEKYPYITVVPEYQAQDGYGEKVNTQLAAGNAPDVIQVGGDFSDYSRRGVLLPLDDQLGDTLHLDALPDGFLRPARFEEKLYGVPLATNGIAIIVNKAMFDRAGMELPPSDWTWDDVPAYAEQLRAALGEDVFLITDRAREVSYFDFFLRQRGKSLVKDGAINFEAQDVADWFSMWQSWAASGAAPDAETASAFNELDVNNSLVPAGRAAMTMNWINQLPNFDNAMEDELALIPLPAGGEGSESGFWLHPAQFWIVPATTEHPREAALFADFTINDPEATQILGVDRGFPGNPEVLSTLKEASEPVVQTMVAYFDEFIANAGPISPAIPNGAEFGAAFTNAWQEVGFERKTVEEAAADVVAAAEAAIAK
jgi:multiple sugar transport system substrate-binding protein